MPGETWAVRDVRRFDDAFDRFFIVSPSTEGHPPHDKAHAGPPRQLNEPGAQIEHDGCLLLTYLVSCSGATRSSFLRGGGWIASSSRESPDSGEVHRITHDDSDELEPRRSRDGRWIYFGSNRTGRFEGWRVPTAGGAAIPITRQGGLTATESPDGRFLYYAKGTVSPTSIWRVPVGGGDMRPIYSDPIGICARRSCRPWATDPPVRTALQM